MTICLEAALPWEGGGAEQMQMLQASSLVCSESLWPLAQVAQGLQNAPGWPSTVLSLKRKKEASSPQSTLGIPEVCSPAISSKQMIAFPLFSQNCILLLQGILV